MRLKIIIFLLFLQILYPSLLFSIGKDSIRTIILSTGAIISGEDGKQELLPAPHSFFDVDIRQIVIGIDLERSDQLDTTQFLFLEIKKKSLLQFRLRPIVSKKVAVTNALYYTESLSLPDSLFGSGNYDVIVSYMKDSFKVADIKKAPFQLLRDHNFRVQDEFFAVDSDVVVNNTDLAKTFVHKYEITQLKKNIQSLSPLAKGAELKAIKDLSFSNDVTTLKQFFYNFWYNRNPEDPEKAWNDYVIILNDLAKKYGSSTIPGYESDRGRIYIQYGAPDRITRVINEKKALPYEVWFYYRSGTKTNLKFLFFQPGMLNNFMILLHSNQSDEIINPYWKDMLLQDPNDGDNKLTHKVFEFFN